MEYELVFIVMGFLGFVAFLFAMSNVNKNGKREVIIMPQQTSAFQSPTSPVATQLPPPPPEQTVTQHVPSVEQQNNLPEAETKTEPEAPKPKPEPVLYRYTASCAKLEPLESIMKGLRALKVTYTTGYNPNSTGDEQPQNILLFTSEEINGLESAEKHGVHLKKEKIEKKP
jgi:hypothetical protein